MLTFCSLLPIDHTMFFEALYEPSLRLDAADKRRLIAAGTATWLLEDSRPIGETFGISPHSYACLFDDTIEDCDPNDLESIYCYGTTIIPQCQNRGLAKLLKAFWLGRVTERGFARVLGHSTTPAMAAINRSFGAQEGTWHEGWYGTERLAIFYELPLDVRSPVQHDAGDCGIAAATYLMQMNDVVVPTRSEMIAVSKASNTDGLSHDNLLLLLRHVGLSPVIHHGSIARSPCPAIVNYQWEGDGHYGVLVARKDTDVFIFNPAFGRIDCYKQDIFDLIFWSARYGRKWSVSC